MRCYNRYRVARLPLVINLKKVTSSGVQSSHIFSARGVSRHATWIKIQVITVSGKDPRAPVPRESRPEEKGEAERVEESGLRQEIGGIHYPELLVILEREACARRPPMRSGNIRS